MSSWDLRKYRNDLSTLIQVINLYGVPGDFSEFENLKDNLDRNGIIDYNLKNLCFYVGPISGTTPSEALHFQIFLDNFLKYKDNHTEDVDPLFKYKLEINIHGYKNKKMEGNTFRSSWHLDQHTPSEIDKYCHPSYHFQFGGNKVKSLATGQLLVLATPRIPHPPMDIFLGFHFIISNYFNNQEYNFVKLLMNDYDYQEIIKRAQHRLWLPYFGAFNPNNTNRDFTKRNVFPLYING